MPEAPTRREMDTICGDRRLGKKMYDTLQAIDSLSSADAAILETMISNYSTILAGVGAKNGATVTAAETVLGDVHKTVLTMASTPITLTDEGGVGQYGGVKLYDFPAGNIQILGAILDASITLLTPFIDTAEGDVGIGTTAVTDGNALATTEQNIIPTTAIAALVSKVGPIDAISATASQIQLNGTATAIDAYINVRIDDDAAHATTASNLISGTLTLYWRNLGDI